MMCGGLLVDPCDDSVPHVDWPERAKSIYPQGLRRYPLSAANPALARAIAARIEARFTLQRAHCRPRWCGPGIGSRATRAFAGAVATWPGARSSWQLVHCRSRWRGPDRTGQSSMNSGHGERRTRIGERAAEWFPCPTQRKPSGSTALWIPFEGK